MSSPIAIPRAQAPSATTDTPLSTSATSSTGKYVPIHKRVGSNATPSAPTSSSKKNARSPSPSHPHPQPQKRNKRTHSRNRSMFDEHVVHDIPVTTKIPNIYSMSELLALSTTITPQLSPSQLSNLQELLPYAYEPPSASSSRSKAKKASTTATSTTVSAPTSVQPAQVQTEKRRQNNHSQEKTIKEKKTSPRLSTVGLTPEERKRQGWGWHPHTHAIVHAEESWRHEQPQILALHA